MSVNSVQEAAKFIREGIREGKFVPGQRLIAREVADLAGGGVGAFREALVGLAGEGLVTLHPNRGAAVRQLGKDDVQEIYLLLERIYPLAARLCTQRFGCGESADADAENMREVANVLEQACRSGRVSEFHSARHHIFEIIRESCGAPRVCEIAQGLSLVICKRENESQMTKNAIFVSQGEIQAIVSYILGHEGAKAERAVRSHVKRLGSILLADMGAAQHAG